jgi:hypothetical protein
MRSRARDYWLATTTLRAQAAVGLGDLDVARAAYAELLAAVADAGLLAAVGP